MATIVGPDGSVGRFGGDEFLVLFDRTSEHDAHELSELILGVVAEPIYLPSGPINVSASAGLAMLGGVGVEAALHNADTAMYRAKQLGRNRVVRHSDEPDDWALTRKKDLEMLTEQVEVLKIENQALAEAAIIDTRTGLPNSEAFDNDHAHLHDQLIRSADRYAVILADIDHFHAYNGRYHYLAGHAALAAVATAIAGAVRRSDRAYRYGGEEFTVLLPDTTLAEAEAVAERIRSEVEKLGIEHLDSPGNVVTVSVGVTQADPGHPDPASVIEDVNRLLLKAKQDGRNRVLATAV
jgi:diguanylate cyclase (GGDEF)-like protein